MYHNNKMKLYSLRASIEKHFDEFTDLVREAKEDELKRKLIKKIRRKKERVHFFFFLWMIYRPYLTNSFYLLFTEKWRTSWAPFVFPCRQSMNETTKLVDKNGR